MLPCNLRYSLDTNISNKFPVSTSIYRHSYLLRDISCITDFNPRLAARIMDKEMSFHTTYRNLEPPALKLTSSHPVIYCPNVDGTREKIPFGRWALPKLKKLIHHYDILVVMKALNSINDLVHDPEKAFQAIGIGLIDRMQDMMLHEKDFVREKICMIFCTLAGQETGKRTIVRRYKILKNLALLLDDPVDAVKYKAQMLVERLSTSSIGAEAINNADFLLLLLRLVGGTPNTKDGAILALHLDTLKTLLNRDYKELALKHNAMNIFIEKTNHEDEKVVCKAIECIAILCQIPEGRQEGAEKELGVLLCRKLLEPSMDVRIKVCGALMFATIQSETRKHICKKCTVDALVEVLENFHSSEGQLMASKVLCNLSEEPEGKSLLKKLKGKVKAMFTNNNEDVERHKKILLSLLKKKN